MIAWMLYSVLAGICTVIAACAADWLLRAYRRPIRFVWMAAAALTTVLAAIAPLRSQRAAHAAPASMDLASLPLMQTGLESVQHHVPASATLYILVLWALATLLVATTFLVVYGRVGRARRAWPIVELDGRRVRVSPTMGPLVLGLVRPEIIVPRWVLGRTRDERRVILAHEAAHVEAGDPILLGVACALVTLMPWNPALWIILSRLGLAIEIDCDTRVLRSGVTFRSYSSLLVDVAESATPLRFAATALADDASHLHQRILAMHPRRFRHPLLRGAAAALIGLTALLAACEAKMPTASDIARLDAQSAEGSARSLGLVSDTSLTWLVDGVVSSAAIAKRIPADSIARVEVTKLHARSHIIILTKAAERAGGGDSAILTGHAAAAGVTSTETPLVVIDGQRSDATSLRSLDRTRIARVDVLKGALAAKLYGDDGRNGVIVVTTKAPGSR